MTDYMVYYKDRDGAVRGCPSVITASSEEEAVALFKEEVQPSEQGFTVDLHVFNGYDESRFPQSRFPQSPPHLLVSAGKGLASSITLPIRGCVLPIRIFAVMLLLAVGVVIGVLEALKKIYMMFKASPPKGDTLSQPAGIRSSQQVVYRGVRRLRRMLQLRRMPWAARKAPVAP